MYKIQLLGGQFSSIFAITPQLYIFFTLKVLCMAIDHSECHYVNCLIDKLWNMFSTLYEMNCCTRYFMSEKYTYLCDF